MWNVHTYVCTLTLVQLELTRYKWKHLLWYGTTVMQYLSWYGYHGNGVEHLLSYGCHSKERQHYLLHSRDALVDIGFNTRYQVKRHMLQNHSRFLPTSGMCGWGSHAPSVKLRVPSVWWPWPTLATEALAHVLVTSWKLGNDQCSHCHAQQWLPLLLALSSPVTSLISRTYPSMHTPCMVILQ